GVIDRADRAGDRMLDLERVEEIFVAAPARDALDDLADLQRFKRRGLAVGLHRGIAIELPRRAVDDHRAEARDRAEDARAADAVAVLLAGVGNHDAGRNSMGNAGAAEAVAVAALRRLHRSGSGAGFHG